MEHTRFRESSRVCQANTGRATTAPLDCHAGVQRSRESPSFLRAAVQDVGARRYGLGMAHRG